MSEQKRTVLGRVDYDAATPYDLAVVLVDYIRSSSAFDGGVANVAEALTRWQTELVRKAAPSLADKHHRIKARLTVMNSQLTDLLHTIDREAPDWREGTKTNEPER